MSDPVSGTERIRPTVRVLLFDPLDRLLLFRFTDTNIGDPDSPEDHRPRTFWATVGGGVNPGESLREAAHREILEETGMTNVALGRVVLERATVLMFAGERVRFEEQYLIGRTRATTISRDGMEAHERGVMGEARWWTLEELRTTDDVIFPEGLADLVAAVLHGPDPTSTGS